MRLLQELDRCLKIIGSKPTPSNLEKARDLWRSELRMLDAKVLEERTPEDQSRIIYLKSIIDTLIPAMIECGHRYISSKNDRKFVFLNMLQDIFTGDDKEPIRMQAIAECLKQKISDNSINEDSILTPFLRAIYYTSQGELRTPNTRIRITRYGSFFGEGNLEHILEKLTDDQRIDIAKEASQLKRFPGDLDPLILILGKVPTIKRLEIINEVIESDQDLRAQVLLMSSLDPKKGWIPDVLTKIKLIKAFIDSHSDWLLKDDKNLKPILNEMQGVEYSSVLTAAFLDKAKSYPMTMLSILTNKNATYLPDYSSLVGESAYTIYVFFAAETKPSAAEFIQVCKSLGIEKSMRAFNTKNRSGNTPLHEIAIYHPDWLVDVFDHLPKEHHLAFFQQKNDKDLPLYKAIKDPQVWIALFNKLDPADRISILRERDLSTGQTVLHMNPSLMPDIFSALTEAESIEVLKIQDVHGYLPYSAEYPNPLDSLKRMSPTVRMVALTEPAGSQTRVINSIARDSSEQFKQIVEMAFDPEGDWLDVEGDSGLISKGEGLSDRLLPYLQRENTGTIYIPPQATFLDLSKAGFHNKAGNEPRAMSILKLEALQLLPPSITHVDLSGHALHQKDKDLKEFLKILPKTVTHIAFDKHHLIPKTRLQILQNIRFKTHLETIESKVAEMDAKTKQQPIYKDATIVAHGLKLSLERAQEEFLTEAPEGPDAEEAALNTFLGKINTAIEKAQPTLERHRGWTKVLTQIASMIVSVISLGIANCVMGKNMHALFTPQPTDAMKKIDQMQSEIKSIRDIRDGEKPEDPSASLR